MAISFISNDAALNSQSNIARASSKASASIARLSSGQRIQKASDDVSGLAIGTALRSQVNTLKTALNNAAQGTSLLQVADGGLSQIVDILQRQKAIATQAASGQLTDANRALLNQEFTALTAEIDRIATSVNFNGVNLLNGGLGAKTSLVTTDALAAAAVIAAPSLSGGSTPTAGTKAIQAFDTLAGTVKGTVATIGHVALVDATNTALVDSAFLGTDSSVYGQFSSFKFTNVNYGATTAGSATLTAVLNGVEYVGTTAGSAGATSVTLVNGNTRLRLGVGTLSFDNASSTETTRATIADAFLTTTIMRVNAVSGVDFTGTAMEGVIGAGTSGVANIRLASNGAVDISDFRYVSSGTAADTSLITVKVNGQTFTSNNTDDLITGGDLEFLDSSELQVLRINVTGINANITNIRTSLTDRANFINALNQGFSKTGSGLNFSIGSASTDNIRVQFGSVSSNTLYNGQTLSVASASSAQAASVQLDLAITNAVSVRSTVGALQSRFNFASNAVQSALENQDAARGSLLDTDVSSESSAYASAQVQLQAGISVLAQANQLPQALLKLIG